MFIEDVFMYKMSQVLHSFASNQVHSPALDDKFVDVVDVKVAASSLAKPLFFETLDIQVAQNQIFSNLSL